MKLSFANVLGRFSNRYNFSDGSFIRATSRESLSYTAKSGEVFHIQLYSDGYGRFEYALPEHLSDAIAKDLSNRMGVYFRNKRLKQISHQADRSSN